MAWKNDGAVERGATLRPRKDLMEGAGETAALKRNGYFERRPHLLGLALILLSTLLLIIAARTARHYAVLDFQCRPGDVNTINGTRICGVQR